MSFKIGNCKVTVSFFFFAVLCICSLADSKGIMLFGIIAAFLHECGHLISAFVFGLSPKALTVNSSGLKMYIPNLTTNRKACIIIAFSGAAANLVIFALSCPFLKGFAAANLGLCILSLLPCDPFDGGIILRSLIEFRCSEEKAEKILFFCTLIILILLVTFGTFILLRTKYNFSLLTLSMLIFTTICQRTLQ